MGSIRMEAREADQRFGGFIKIENITGGNTSSRFILATTTYLMERKTSIKKQGELHTNTVECIALPYYEIAYCFLPAKVV